MLNKGNYKDIIVINKEGIIIYADIGNPQYFKVGLNNVKGKKLKELYIGIKDNYPLLKAVNKGTAFDYFEVELTTSRNIKMIKKGCAYPLYYNDKPIGAVEFADFFYDKNHIGETKNHADHPIYRGNNTKYLLEDIVTEDKSIIGLKSKIEKYAISDSTVLIYGETGTGKELVAQALHNSGKRCYSKFISQNCSAIPENLLESTLFGTTKGSFTGAKDNPGLFELADGGTLFLDEINSLNISLQVKILKAIEEKRIRRIGSPQEIDVDVRIIAATNEEPETLIKEKRLKPDLFYRLAVIYIRLPRLWERGNDIYVLANYFINYFNNKMNLNIKTLNSEIIDVLKKYSWPGNVRELRNVIECAFAFAENNTITLKQIPSYIINSANNDNTEKRIYFSQNDAASFTEKTKMLEKALIIQAYEESGHSLKNASEKLKISKQLMYYKLKRYGICE